MTPALCDEGEAPAPAASREDVRQRSRSPARMHAHAHANEHLQLPTTPPLGRPRMRAHSDVQVIDALFLSPRVVVAKADEEEERDEVEEELVVVEEQKDEEEEAAERARSLPGDLHLSTRSHSAASLAIGGGGGGGGEGGGGGGGGDGHAAPSAPSPEQPTPPDGGWGWVVVFASFMIHIINDGVTYSFGIFYDALVTYFDSGRGETAWILSILVGVTLCSGPISSSCVNKYGCRAVTVVGGLLAAVSMALSVFAPNVQTLYVTIGLGTGLGFGLAYLPAIVSVTCYFERLRSLATGIAVCGSGLGTFLLAPITRELVEQLGWRHALLVVSAMVLSCAAFGALFRPLRAPDPAVAFDALVDEGAGAAATATPRGHRRRRSQTLSSAGSSTSLQAELRLKATPATTNLRGAVPPGDSAPLTPVTPTTALARPRSVELLALAGEKGEKLQPVYSAPARSTSGVTENTGSRGRRWARSQPTLAVSRANHAGGVETRLASVGAASVGAAAGSGAGAWRFGGGVMRRKDILYSGSLRHLPQHKSASYLHPEAARLLTEVASLFPARATGPGDGHPQRAHAGSAGDEAEEREPRRLCGCLSLSEETDAVLREMLNFSLLRDPVFLLFAVSNFLTSIGFNVPYLYVAVQAKARGVSAERAGWLLSAIGFANTVGRVALGYISDKPWVDRLLLYNVCLTVCGVATAFSALCDSYASFLVFACVFGGSIGAYVGLTSVVLVDLLGLERLTNGFGLLLLFQGIASFVGPPIAGWLYDATLSYDPGFIVAGVTMALSGLVLFLIPPVQRRLAAQQKMAEAALSAGGAGAGANVTAARTPAVA